MTLEMLHTPTQIGDGFLLVQNPSHAKTESHLILLTSDCVAIHKLTVWQYATTTPMTTFACCMALYHVRHAVTLLFETTLYCAVPNGQQSVITQNVISEGAKCKKPHIIFIIKNYMLPIIL